MLNGISYIKKHRGRKGRIGALAAILFCIGMSQSFPVRAAGNDLDVTINVVGPSQDVKDVIEHEIVLPASNGATQDVLAHGEHEHQGLDGHSEAGGSAEPSEVSQQATSASQEARSVEHQNQTQELMNQAQQSAQTPQDREVDTD
ncbi:hypothetical protein BI364_13855 [Acidihalobacter yilgarnensis]|uniref:Uncharacterized protein n=1 Tax=Acidihalobacter yilgarnensis TaxID=2819280 RepID=A0A1D8IR67_9GAMM|nr:hypothetical protein [Acidihalobacter yilgarnensis]AOU98895.1 hypothetical protein BI364_13855 [Acidihalobacter yilgarnensis]